MRGQWPMPSRIRRIAGDLSDLIYPSACRACGEASDAWLCPGCQGALTALTDATACPACGRAIAEPGAACVHCKGKGRGRIRRTLRLAGYEPPLPALLHQAKFHHGWEIAERLADRLYESAAVRDLLKETDLLVPVPLHRWRQVVRGYNQAQVIARRLSSLSGVPVSSAVLRIRNTKPQSLLRSHASREQNLRDAFVPLRLSTFGGRRVTIVDDVTTTGATLVAMARALRTARPASLAAIVLAVAEPHH